MTTYKIIHYTKNAPLGENVFTSNVFRKTELQSQFDALVKKLNDGESAEYMKENSTHFYPSMLYVEKQNGKLYRYDYCGNKRLYN